MHLTTDAKQQDMKQRRASRGCSATVLSYVYFATLLIYNDSVVGGDVASSRQNGVMHGFSMPAAQPSSGAFLPESPESEEISENLS